MKKCSAVIFLIIFGFHNFGYLAYVKLVTQRTTHRWLQQKFSPDDPRLVTFKYPIQLSAYFTAQYDFLPTDGLINIEDKPHRIVFKKITADSVFIKTLPDYLTLRVEHHFKDWINQINSRSDGPSSQKHVLKTLLVKDYYLEPISQVNFYQSGLLPNLYLSLAYQSRYLPIATPPPELV